MMFAMETIRQDKARYFSQVGITLDRSEGKTAGEVPSRQMV